MNDRNFQHYILYSFGAHARAFYLWDKALKEGDPRIIGSISYSTLFLANLWLILFTGEKLTIISGLGMVLLFSGSLIGSLDMLRSTQALV
jgi:drug/metabolite transporter (DMT)-like permease